MFSDATAFRILFYLTTALELIVAFLLLRRQLLREVTWFCIYIAFQILGNTCTYLLYESGDRAGFFYGAWSFEGISVVLSFMVLLEVFRISVTEYETIHRFGIRLLIFAAVLSLVIALALTPYGYKASVGVVKFMMIVERSLRIIQLALLVAMFALSSYLALSWKSYVFGIALGYGLYAAVNLSCNTYLAYLGHAAYANGSTLGRNLMRLDSASWSCAVAIWLIYLLKQEAKPPALPPSADQDLKEWIKALSDLDKAAR